MLTNQKRGEYLVRLPYTDEEMVEIRELCENIIVVIEHRKKNMAEQSKAIADDIIDTIIDIKIDVTNMHKQNKEKLN